MEHIEKVLLVPFYVGLSVVDSSKLVLHFSVSKQIPLACLQAQSSISFSSVSSFFPFFFLFFCMCNIYHLSSQYFVASQKVYLKVFF